MIIPNCWTCGAFLGVNGFCGVWCVRLMEREILSWLNRNEELGVHIRTNTARRKKKYESHQRSKESLSKEDKENTPTPQEMSRYRIHLKEVLKKSRGRP